MEFPFNINELFHNTITKLEGQSLIKGCNPNFGIVLDLIGEASRNAQNLHRPVTSANSFISSDQILYVLTDPKRNNGNGAVLGIIKTGPKKLFLLNHKGVQHEMNLSCILDFYIHESCQRMGLGKLLFDHFLKVEDFDIKRLVIDRPSNKFLAFLQKHYKLHDIIPQVNNFVIFEGFFGQEELASASNQYRSSLPNRWNSMINVNAAGDSSPFRSRGNQSSISCLFDQPTKSNENNNDLWRANSVADFSKPSLQPTVFPPQPVPTSNPTKFNHHRLW